MLAQKIGGTALKGGFSVGLKMKKPLFCKKIVKMRGKSFTQVEIYKKST